MPDGNRRYGRLRTYPTGWKQGMTCDESETALDKGWGAALPSPHA
jgi:hypothetical protein